MLWRALRLLTATASDDIARDWRRLCHETVIAPAATSADNSPALAGIDDRQGRREFDAPIYLNTAIRELLTSPRDRGDDIERRPERIPSRSRRR